MKKILVTGATGFFGSRFCEYHKSSYNILGLGKKDLDISNENKTIEVIKQFQPDYVLHTAAIADTGVCERNPEFSSEINVKGSINVAKACELTKSKLINLSSEQVYNGNVERGPYSESITPIPNTVYGEHKLLVEEEISKVMDSCWNLRLTWMFGFPERNLKVNSNIIMNTIKSLILQQVYKVPINEFRGMTYVYDVVRAIPLIMDIPYGIYNTGSENDLSTYEISKYILEKLKINEKNKFILKDEEKYKDLPRDLRISNKKLKDYGVEFNNTKKGIDACLKEFNYLL